MCCYNIFIRTIVAGLVMALLSCGGATHQLGSGDFSKDDHYNINSYYGCCGCEARYFTIRAGKRIMEQVICAYNCDGNGIPVKFIFHYNKLGKRTSCDRYVATVGNDFVFGITSEEKKLFGTLSSDPVLRIVNPKMIFAEIKGFRKPAAGESVHSFPLVKNGSGLPVN